MGSYLQQHRRAWRECRRYLRAHAAMTALVWLLLGIGLALPAALHLLADNLAAIDARFRSAPALSVFFTPGLPAAEGQALLATLRRTAGVAAVEHVPPAAGLALIGIDPAALQSANPLPAVALLQLADGVPAEAVAARLAGTRGIDQVVAEEAWRDRLDAAGTVLSRLGALLTAVLVVASMGLAGASVRLALDTGIDEVRVAMLVGATDAQLRRPFLYLGAAYGLGGALVATLLVAVTLAALARPVAALGQAYGWQLSAGTLPLDLVGVLAGGGALLGIAGALAGVRGALRNPMLR
jgi:cell division transport system permease protein